MKGTKKLLLHPMIYLIFSIICSALIFALFKTAELRKVDNIAIIIINYITALGLGFLLNDIELNLSSTIHSSWFSLALIIGVLFIANFFLIGFSSQKAGISATTVSAKMSVVIPILFSILYDPNDHLTLSKQLGVALALVALFLTVYKKRDQKTDLRYIFLPVILFVGMGLVDSFVKYAQQDYLDDSNLSLFSAFTFAGAFVTGLVILAIIRYPLKKFASPTPWVIGSFLGAVNFGSMYFLVLALEKSMIAGSAIFGINNIGIVGLSVMIALLFFKEKLRPINWAGIVVSLFAVWILAGA